MAKSFRTQAMRICGRIAKSTSSPVSPADNATVSDRLNRAGGHMRKLAGGVVFVAAWGIVAGAQRGNAPIAPRDRASDFKNAALDLISKDLAARKAITQRILD